MVEKDNNLKASVEKVLEPKSFHIDLPYNSEDLINSLKELSSSNNWDPAVLCTLLLQIGKPLKTLSSAMGKLGEKLQERIAQIRAVYALFKDESLLSIQDICLLEKTKGISHCNKKDNKKLGFKDAPYKDYLSLSCTLNMIVRMFNFQKHIYSNFVNIKNKGPKDNIKAAFDVTLAKHFNFVKRGLFSTAVSFVTNDRKELFKAVFGNDTIDEKSEASLKEIADSLEIIYQKIVDFTSSNSLIVTFSD